MSYNLRRRLAAPFLVFAFATAALANLSETTVLQSTNAINLDTGAFVNSGGDIVWDVRTLTPRGNAKVRNLGAMGPLSFDTLGQSYFAQQAASAKTDPISAALLVPGDVFVVVTNGGNIAKVLVLANERSALTIRFTTFGVSAESGMPAVNQILNNSSGVPPGYPNYGIAPSSLFVVKGSSLADPGDPVLQSSVNGLPPELNGASLTAVVNGVTTHPALYYTSPTQLAAVLPAATPVGSGTLTVTYRGKTSAPAPLTVVPSALGINSYYTNSAVATDAATGALLTYTNSGSPGQTIILWSTGLGADAADSDTTYTLTPHAVSTPLQIYIGGVAAAILYQGASTFPGVNQINLTIPQSVPSGCWVPLAAITGEIVSNVVTLPIHGGGGACLDVPSGLTGAQVTPSGGQTLRAGQVSLIHTNTASNSGRTIDNAADTAFVKYTGLYAPAYALSPGGCIAGPVVASPIPSVTGLDVGSVTITGPSGTPTTMRSQGIKGVFFSNLAANGIPDTGGSFTFAGTGGADVGPFTATINLSNPLLAWFNPTAAATIDRTKPLNITWGGGNPGSYVIISGSSRDSATGLVSRFNCMAPANDRNFTVPSYILLALPAGIGATMVQNIIQSPLSASGIDIGVSIADIGYSVSSTYVTGASGGGNTGTSGTRGSK